MQRDIPRDYSKKMRSFNQDENLTINNVGAIGGKTVQVRGKIKNQVEPYKVHKDPNYYPASLYENKNESENIKNISKTKPSLNQNN